MVKASSTSVTVANCNFRNCRQARGICLLVFASENPNSLQSRGRSRQRDAKGDESGKEQKKAVKKVGRREERKEWR